jgi:hypothetical protein
MSAKSCQKLKLCLCGAVNGSQAVAENFKVVDAIATAKNLNEIDAKESGIEKVIELSELAIKANEKLNDALMKFGVKITDL